MSELWVSIILAAFIIGVVGTTLWGIVVIFDLFFRQRPRDNDWRLAERLVEKVNRWPARW